MYISSRVLIGFAGMCVVLTGALSAPAAVSNKVAFYEGLEPGVFMRQWLVCGPFPVFENEQEPGDEAEARLAFDHDFLAGQGGETAIVPDRSKAIEIEGARYYWRTMRSREDIVSLLMVYGAEKHVIAYAWSEIEMPEAKSALLGIGSDDAVKVWLNGELVHENWTGRDLQEDNDLVVVHLQAGKNHLLLKVQNYEGSWGFSCRVLDAKTLGDRLCAAVHDGDSEMVELCLAHGADTNAKDRKGFTPLHMARMWGHEELAQQLLDHGADPNIAMPVVGTPLGFLDSLWDALKQNYPMMEYAGAFDESWYESCKEAIRDASGLGEALPIMDRMLVMRLNDYHTRLSWETKPHLVTPPIRLGLVEGRIVVTQCAEGLGVAPGDIVLEIDGDDAKACFDGALPDAFGATKYAKARAACQSIIKGEPDTEVALKLRSAEDEIQGVTLTRGGHLPVGQSEGVLSSRDIDDDFGYIRIRGWGGFSTQEFDKLLEPLREKPCLIIDVRDNGGGSDELAETVIGRFIEEKVLCSVSFQRQPGTDTYDKLIHIADPRGPWRYRGKVAVLTNEGCASACEHFVSGMFEAGALLVGRPTIGACGWSQGIELPCGVTLSCSLTFPLHGKTPSPLNGIAPHHLVLPTIEDIRSGRDTTLEEAKRLLMSQEDTATDTAETTSPL